MRGSVDESPDYDPGSPGLNGDGGGSDMDESPEYDPGSLELMACKTMIK